MNFKTNTIIFFFNVSSLVLILLKFYFIDKKYMYDLQLVSALFDKMPVLFLTRQLFEFY